MGPESSDNRYEGRNDGQAGNGQIKERRNRPHRNGRGSRCGLTAQHLGGHSFQLRHFPATFLGSSEITLAELALAYTTFPNAVAANARTF